MKKYALIVAGGSGNRMGTDTPKQFLLLKGEPVLMHTIRAFAAVPDVEIHIVLPESQILHWQELCRQYSFPVPHTIVNGGPTRFHSVKNGLVGLDADSLVAIHDGVRPLIRPDIITSSFDEAAVYGSAVVAVKLKDSLREQLLTGETRSVDRSNYYQVQTPQTFRTEVIREAYANANHENFTDDAGVAEANQVKIRLIAGEYRNIKLTTPEDMAIAEVLVTFNQ